MPSCASCSANCPLSHTAQSKPWSLMSSLRSWALRQAGIKGADPERPLKGPGFCLPPGKISPVPASTTTSCLPPRIHPPTTPQHQSSQKPQVRFGFTVSLTCHFISNCIPVRVSQKGQTHRFPVTSSSSPLRMWSRLELSLNLLALIPYPQISAS